MQIKCRLCSQESGFLFSGLVLNKYRIKYYRCPTCGFIQTETPYWLSEAYQKAITSLDLGYVSRNVYYADLLSMFILKNRSFDADGKFLDYGGGYGMFVRLMRDKGFDFYREDAYCENLFANYFDVQNVSDQKRFEMLTCFEVFEHLAEPYVDIERMLTYSQTIFFSTRIQPETELRTTDDWEYFAPETGQHISFYTLASLQVIANKYRLNLYTNGEMTHILTDKTLEETCFADIYKRPSFFQKVKSKILGIPYKLPQRNSLIMSDVEYVKSQLK